MAHDHNRCIAEALERAEALCQRRGVRFTPLRRRVLELIWQDHRAVKAYDLLAHLAPPRKPITVYRALDFLAEQGLIHRLATLNAFVGCSLPQPHRAILFVCHLCHGVEERPAEEALTALHDEAKRCRFTPVSEVVEVLGLCRCCRARGDRV